MGEEEKDLKARLVAKRGYIKGTLTRLLKVAQNKEWLVGASVQLINAKLNHLKQSFADYEMQNCEIFALDPNDSEDISTIEENYHFTYAGFMDELSKRKDPNPSPPHSQQNRLKLPTINIEPFNDGYTARAFQLERDVEKEPTVNELLSFLEKRALAAETTPATTSNWKPAARLAVNVAVQDPTSCLNCIGAALTGSRARCSNGECKAECTVWPAAA